MFDTRRNGIEVTRQALYDQVWSTPMVILGNLELIEKHGLKRAACLLFSSRPEQYVSGAWIKIGFFVTDDDLRLIFPRFHRHLHKWENDEIGGPHEHQDQTAVYGRV